MIYFFTFHPHAYIFRTDRLNRSLRIGSSPHYASLLYSRYSPTVARLLFGICSSLQYCLSKQE
jgi:hypothetical protein